MSPTVEPVHPEIDAGMQQRLWSLLMDERHRLRELYRHDVRAGWENTPQASEDSIDDAERGYERDFAFALSDVERERVRLIDEALERMEQGSYGFCLHSGRPIPLSRLLEIPWARYGADVQARVERGLPPETGTSSAAGAA